MPETGENVAQEHGISRQDQDAFALRSQQRAAAAQADGWFAEEIAPVTVTDRKGRETVIAADEHLRPDTSAERLAKLAPLVRADGTVTAGNASGVNDGAAAMIVRSEEHTSELQSLMRIPYAVFRLKKKTTNTSYNHI